MTLLELIAAQYDGPTASELLDQLHDEVKVDRWNEALARGIATMLTIHGQLNCEVTDFAGNVIDQRTAEERDLARRWAIQAPAAITAVTGLT